MEKILYVGSERVTCTGVTLQQCLKIKERPEDAWGLLYSGIGGFDFEEGSFYTLLVREEEVEHPPADASSIKLTLLDILDQSPVDKLAETLQGSRWRLQSLGPNEEALQSLIDQTEITLEFTEQGHIAGSSGCNRYTAGIRFEGASVQIQTPASTRRACLQEDVMAQEQSYLEALSSVDRLELFADTLKLAGEGQMLLYVRIGGDTQEAATSEELQRWNGIIAQAAANGAPWTRNPLLIALIFLDPEDAPELRLERRDDSSENARRSTITLLENGFLDDSVRGSRRELVMIRQQDGSWQIESLIQAYRCQRGEHMDDYTADNCP